LGGRKLKKKMMIFASLLLVVFSVIIVTMVNGNSKFRVPEISEIDSIKIVPATFGANPRDEFFFDLSKKEHRVIVNNILIWLKASKLILGDFKGETSYSGSTPTYIIIKLKNGTSIAINSTVGSIETDILKGVQVHSQGIDGKDTIYVGEIQKHTIEVSPELISFIDNGWKLTFNYTK
jgi:hypothetical protein